MKLNRISFSLITAIGLVAVAACNDTIKASAEVPAPAVSDTDTTDETATSAPPADEAENPGAPPAAGDVWEKGVYRFEGGKYVWNRGRWEHARPGFTLVQARWVEDHGKWVRHPGRWEKGGDHPGEGKNEGRPNEAKNEGRPNEGKPNEGKNEGHDKKDERR